MPTYTLSFCKQFNETGSGFFDVENSPSEMGILSVLNFSDGEHSLLDISIRSKVPFQQIKEAADLLVESNLLELINDKLS